MRTNTRPWDYERRVPTPPDDLFTECPNCGYRMAVKDGELISCYNCHVLHQLPEETAEEFKALRIVVGYVPPEPEFVDDWCWQLEDWPGELGESPTELRSLYGYG